jgi:hypothetical protein
LLQPLQELEIGGTRQSGATINRDRGKKAAF